MDGGDRKGIFKMSNPQPWESEFRALFERTRAKVAGGERNLERLFSNFHAVKFFLAKDNLREVIVTR